jgi:cyclomaltodextrinase / maltogenic alpha-amylase / neopullulanase
MKKIIFLLFVFTSILSAQEIRDLIKPLNLIAGKTDSVLISDLFYTKDYSLKFLPNENIEFSYSPSNNMLYLAPLKNFEGIGLIEFTVNKANYVIPFKSEVLQEKSFKYTPQGDFRNVNLFGSFNSWNRQELPMKDLDKDGTYEISIPLQPGRYEYKFFVDGKEIVDPDNPEKFPNGMGDFNSVLVVEPLHSEKSYLHLVGKREKGIQFYYERENQVDSLKKEHLIILLNNKVVPAEQIRISGNYIDISIDEKYYTGDNILRAVVVQNGFPTNIQSIFLNEKIKPDIKQNITPFDKVIYSIMIDRFSDGDTSINKPARHPDLMKQANYNGGDFKGIINKISEGYFDSLGVNTLWLTPVNDNTNQAFRENPPPHRYYSGYHGYWPVHPTRVEENFGDMKLLKSLVSTAHKKQMKVLLDYVAHHVHIEHPYWNEHRNWFGKLELPDGRLNLRLWDEHRLTTWFEPYLPSFDFTASNEALEVMTDNAIWWLKETNIDGFRHDAVKHVPNSFWRRLTEKIKSKVESDGRKIYQIGETFGGYDLISSYVNNGQLDAQFNFNLYDNAISVFLTPTSTFKVLDTEMKKTFNVYGVNHLMGNLMDSHDKTRFMAYADGDIEPGGNNAAEIAWTNPPEVNKLESYKLMKLYMSYLISIPGLPVIYYGDEFGMTGAGDPDNRRMMRFGDDLNIYEKRALEDVRRIVNLRSNHSALRYGDFQTIYVDDNVYVYMRSDLNERIVVALNKSDRLHKINLSFPEVYNLTKSDDLLSEDKAEIKNNTLRINIPPLDYMFLKVN